MITPRTTRLVRTKDLQAFREAVVALACDGSPTEARDCLVIVPTRAAAAHLLGSLENRRLTDGGAALLPDFVTCDDLVVRLSERVGVDRLVLTGAEREVLLGLACRTARASGVAPPFNLRPGLIAEVLRFYDTLRLNLKDVDAFERLALGALEPDATHDHGAERLVRQTRFLVAAFRDFERRRAEAGLDEHELRERLLVTPAGRPYRHLVVAVGDRAFDPHGLSPADWDLVARIPGLERLDIVVTETVLAGAFHERIHLLLPGIDETRIEQSTLSLGPALRVPPGGSLVHVSRDREEEIADCARRLKTAARRGDLRALDRAAIVVHQPLPYVYIAREVLRSAAIPCQTFDALPLAAEPYAAALDLVFSAVSSSFARGPAVALLGSPHFRLAVTPDRFSARDVVALDRALGEAGYLGEIGALESLVSVWRATQSASGSMARALRAGEVLLAVAQELAPLRSPAAAFEHLSRLFDFLMKYETLPGPDDPLRARQLRSRGAILGTLGLLRDAYQRFDTALVEFDETTALVRRWIEGQTFSPRAGDSGVHVVDAASAPFGDFDEVQLAGLVEGEWPDRPRRNIFYSQALLRELGWPQEADRIEGARAAFMDLLRLPARRLTVSTFTLEADALVSPSPFLDDLASAGLEAFEAVQGAQRIFEHEALGIEPVDARALPQAVQDWAALRAGAPPQQDARFRGTTAAHTAAAFSVSALERYQDCPFKFFASEVLRIDEPADDETALSPRARGRFVHRVFQRFFEEWDRRRGGSISSEDMDEARAVMAEVAVPLLERLPDAEAALERTRLFGSAISVGLVEVVLGLEASRPVDVQERWLEYRLEGEFFLGSPEGPSVALKGVADRIDLLSGNRLRIIDYKSGSAPNVKRALQVPIYALCVQERLGARDGVPWAVDEAAYIAFGGKRAFVPVVKPGASEADEALSGARTRLLNVLAGIARGEFPPRPHDPMICRYCSVLDGVQERLCR